MKSRQETESKLSVFVCSTYADLVEERQAVLTIIENLKHRLRSMEHFGAREERPIEACFEEVRQSDLLLVILGHRYGSLVPEQDTSFTEAEYLEGQRTGKPCLVYVRGEDAAIAPRMMEQDPEKLRHLKRFRDHLRLHHTVAEFESPEQLAELVKSDLFRKAQAHQDVVKGWNRDLKDLLWTVEGINSEELWESYRQAFPPGYQDLFSAADAVEDLTEIERTLPRGDLGFRIYREDGGRLHLKVFETPTPLPLSTLLPMLENMGLQVRTSTSLEIRPAPSPGPVFLRDFELMVESLNEQNLEIFRQLLPQVWAGHVEDDRFNRLTLAAGLSWREILVLRAYSRYLRQTGIAFSQHYMVDTLTQHSEIARMLVQLFVAIFEPGRPEDSSVSRDLSREIGHRLEAVPSRDEDRILRRFLNLIDCTLRTNFFQRTASGESKDYLCFKFDGLKLRGLRLPRPVYETFVYSSKMEAVHLRSGRVARGGIRWSDRLEDFRTEVLGLMKAQMLKNSLIIPVGAKGSFILKRPPKDDREATFTEGVYAYQTMIRGLLDITDNIESGKIRPPKQVVCRDPEDPYLVVAADKGTATFSDLANGVAEEYGFWLKDAFASGGSLGYDHKKMGITARGAWQSVKRHFREMGRDIDQEPLTVLGVGDMSGDVFGNGMLLSKQIRLIAAFNHLHIFVDPDPNPEASYLERQRLFDLPRSSWRHYDRSVLSAGGEVFDRLSKSLTLSRQIRYLLGIQESTVTPDQLLRLILRAEVDLLWFGGIGTYVKSREETHQQVGDRGNDEIRVDALTLRCKVVGEGANLGMTQRARIEFASAGGRINTDFIDNSGGVDCSDHEVNIKMVLDDAASAQELTPEGRLNLLSEMTEEVAQLVQWNNYLSGLAISLEESRGVKALDEQVALMLSLESTNALDRRWEFLPDDSALVERRSHRLGLTRPEIAVLISFAKIALYDQLLESDLPSEPCLEDDLRRYFPQSMGIALEPAIKRHLLRREIVANELANNLVNRLGPCFLTRLEGETARPLIEIAKAALAVREIFSLSSLWDEIDALDGAVSPELQYRMHLIITEFVVEATRWFLTHEDEPLHLSEVIDSLEADIVVVAAQLNELVPPRVRARIRRRQLRLSEVGVPEQLAEHVALLDQMASACDIALSARRSGATPERAGRIFFLIGDRFGFDKLRALANRLELSDHWDQAATTAILNDFSAHQVCLTEAIIRLPGKSHKALEKWTKTRKPAVQRLESLLEDLNDTPKASISKLTIAEREIRRLVLSS